MVDTDKMLAELDRFAVESNFPVLDNVHVAVADTRLTVFRRADHWAIMFEVVGFSEPELEFVDDIYAYGNCVVRPGFQGERIVASQVDGKPIRDPATNDCIANRSNWSISIAGKEMSFSPTPKEYSEAGLVPRPPGPGSINEPEILRFLVHALGHSFFASMEQLVVRVPPLEAPNIFLQALAWHHPDVAKGELARDSVALRSLVEAIASGDPKRFNPGEPNTHWKNWIRDS